jgi:AcrR family transcriptional regulator
VLTAVPSRSKLVARATIDRILAATATLWCRNLTFPTAREVGALAGVAPSTVVSAFGGMSELVDAVVATELAHLDACRTAPDPAAAFQRRIAELRTVDPVLGRLPWLVMARAGDRHDDDCRMQAVAAQCMHAFDHGARRA